MKTFPKLSNPRTSYRQVVLLSKFLIIGGVLGIYCSHDYAHASSTVNQRLPGTMKGLDALIWTTCEIFNLPIVALPVFLPDDCSTMTTTVKTKRQIQRQSPGGTRWGCSIGNPNREPISTKSGGLTGLGLTLSQLNEHGPLEMKSTQSVEECLRRVSAQNTEEFIGLMVRGILKQT